MAGLTTSIIMGGAAVGQAASGIIGKKKAKNELRDLEVPELTNAFEDIPISRVGSDLIREESARTNASLVDAAQAGGVRSVMSSIPRLVALNNETNQSAMKYLDDQVIDRNYNYARDEQRIRSMTENRYLGDVQGLNNEIQTQNQNIWSGVRGLVNTVGYADRNGLFNERPSVNTVNELLPQGGAELATLGPTSSLPSIIT